MANKIRKNDEVIIIAGDDKGKVGKVVAIDSKKNRVIVDKINIMKRHRKPTQNNPSGGIVEKEAGISLSNVALKAKGKDGKAIKVGFHNNDKGKKVRFVRSTGKDF